MPESTDTEQEVDVTAVEEMLHLFSRGLRAKRLYMENNPVYQQALESLQQSFAPLWRSRPDLTLELTETEFKCDGQTVLSESNKSDSVSWVLYKDGIRSITLQPGVEEEEVVLLLGIINTARSLTAESSDDLLTLLWEESFLFIKYDFVELGFSDIEPIESKAFTPTATPAQVQKRITEETESGPGGRAATAVADDGDGMKPYFLEPEEIAYLRAEVENEYGQDLKGNVLSMVLDIMELQPGLETRDEVMSIIEDFVPFLLQERDLGAMNYVLDEVQVVRDRAPDLTEEQANRLGQIPALISGGEGLQDLLLALDGDEQALPQDQWGRLAARFTREALRPIIAVLQELKKPELKESLSQIARKLGSDFPDEVSALIGDEDAQIVEQAIHFAGELTLSHAVPAIAKNLQHDSGPLRRAAVDALGAIESPGALIELTKAIDDSDREVRVAAVKVFARTKNMGAFDRIEQAVTGKDLRRTNLGEKMAFFEAYGELAGEQGIETLRPMLLGSGFLGRKKTDPETRACVCVALGRIGGATARSLLENVRDDKDPLVKNAVHKVLQEMA